MSRVLVMLGGWSAEREVSLVSGQAVVEALRTRGHEVSIWDASRDLAALMRALDPRPDAVFNALHGVGGEDGVIQGALDMAQVPYTHSGVRASAVAMDKVFAKAVVAAHGIKSPEGVVLQGGDKVPFRPPYVLKPVADGSSVGVSIVREVAAVPEGEWLVERYVPGRELTVGVLAGRGRPVMAMAVTEIVPNDGFYDYEAKYTDGRARHIVPAEIPGDVESLALAWATSAHTALGCTGVSRSDFRWDDSKPGAEGLSWLELNTQPGMTPLSLVPEQAKHLGIGFPMLCDLLLEAAQCHG